MPDYDLAGALPNLEEIPAKMLRKGMRAAIAVLREAVREEIPHRTGKLAASVRSRVNREGREGVVLVGRRGKGQPWYAHIVSRGAKPHLIPGDWISQRFVPGGRRGLKRIWVHTVRPGYRARINGRWVFIHAFTHPGAKRNQFLERAELRTIDEVQRIVAETVRSAVGEL